MISNLFVISRNYSLDKICLAEIMKAILDGQGKSANSNKCIITITIVLVSPPARRGPIAGCQRGKYNKRDCELVRRRNLRCIMYKEANRSTMKR